MTFTVADNKPNAKIQRSRVENTKQTWLPNVQKQKAKTKLEKKCPDCYIASSKIHRDADRYQGNQTYKIKRGGQIMETAAPNRIH